MLIRRSEAFAGLSTEAALGLTAAWSGAVGCLLLIMILVRSFN